ncbi:MAG: hypothetical protein EOP20_03985 [Hyphomicrobiales bacterium]|nr:MAG: hypothetical protein EOP20_03985 [Hyphomicrobiales bacterium]
MSSEDQTREYAALEAQRRRSNVYAFRRLKWGKPERLSASESRRTGESSAPLPLMRPGAGRAFNVGLIVAVGVVCAVIAGVTLG